MARGLGEGDNACSVILWSTLLLPSPWLTLEVGHEGPEDFLLK